MINFEPMGPRVVIRKEDRPVKVGAIFVPAQAESKTQAIGVVVAAGPGTKDQPMTVKPGDRVVYDPSVCVPIEVDGERFVMTIESNLHGVLR